MNKRRVHLRWDRRRSGGFTLIEVLATMVLMAIVLPVAMKAVSLATMTAGASRHRTEASALAEAKLSELIATSPWQASGTLAGNFGDDWPEYRWQAEVQQWVDSSMEELDVHVLWTSRGSEEFITVSTLVSYGTQSTSTSGTTGTTGQ